MPGSSRSPSAAHERWTPLPNETPSDNACLRIVGRVHGRVLEHIKALSEAEPS